MDIIEVHGRIKWFDMAKGFGFVVPDNGLADILLHVTVLRRDGFQAAPEGAEVMCQAQNRSRGLQVFRVLSMDESTAVHPAQLPMARTHAAPPDVGGFEIVVVKWFNRVKGFGFLTRGRGHGRYFRAYGNLAAFRHRRPQARRLVAGAFRPRPQGTYGRGSATAGNPVAKRALNGSPF